MIASTDPVSFIPSLGPEESAWLSVHAVASDVATSGVSPRFALFELNLPPSLSDEALERYWRSIHTACKNLGISIIGGHTGRFQGCDYTVVGGSTMFAIGTEGAYVTSDMARAGDDVIATKSAAIEATSILARSFPRTVEKHLGRDILEKTKGLFTKISVVEDALTASSIGLRQNGVTAMHDVTEGGVLSAVLEMADASGLGVFVDSESIPIMEGVEEVCRLFRIDPGFALGQGSLIVASRPGHTQKIMKALRRRSIPANIIGRLTRNRRSMMRVKGKMQRLAYPREDPYWHAYWNGVKRRLR
jgi:hydrogenase maturation factor